MAWGSPYNNNRNYRQGGGFSNRSYSYRGGNSYQPVRTAAKKRSGAKHGRTKNGDPYTTGWNASRKHGLVKFLCVPYKKSKQSESANGRQWLNVMVKVEKQMAPEFITSGMMDLVSGKVTVQSLGIVINPKAPNGGYCGRFFGK